MRTQATWPVWLSVACAAAAACVVGSAYALSDEHFARSSVVVGSRILYFRPILSITYLGPAYGVASVMLLAALCASCTAHDRADAGSAPSAARPRLSCSRWSARVRQAGRRASWCATAVALAVVAVASALNALPWGHLGAVIAIPTADAAFVWVLIVDGAFRLRRP